ncbi:Pin2 terf1-interacting telomerase inhibitor 1, partial [Globisporangium splendens]
MAPGVDTTSGAAADAPVDEGQVMVQMGGMQNMAWAADTSKFGYKMLVKMGWAAGKGVGKDLQGQATHVKIARRSENLGVGCSLKQAEVQGWSSTATSFADVLKTLNKKYGDKSDSGSESDASSSSVKKKKKEKKSKKEKKAKKAKKQAKRDKKVKEEAKKTTISRRIVYHKRLRNKNAKGYAAEDMAGILGLAASTTQAE